MGIFSSGSFAESNKGSGDRAAKGGGSHGKSGKADTGKSNIDKSGKPGKHHGGFLSGSSRSSSGGDTGRKPGSFSAWYHGDDKKK
jgi:hypothetical protein